MESFPNMAECEYLVLKLTIKSKGLVKKTKMIIAFQVEYISWAVIFENGLFIYSNAKLFLSYQELKKCKIETSENSR